MHAVKALLLLASSIVCLSVFSAPGWSVEYPIAGTVTIPPPAPGLSAYEIALNNGFVGTEQEWLASLQGPPGAPGRSDGTAAGMCTDALEYGFVRNDATFDNSVVFNQFVADPTLDVLCFPRGSYTFNSPTSTINRAMNIRGLGVNGTTLRRNFLGPLLHATRTVIIENLAIHAVGGKNGSYGVYLEGVGASASILRNLYLTSPDGTTYKGAVRLNGGPQPLGIRGCLLEQIEAFASTSHNVWLQNVKGLVANAVQTYSAGGLAQHIIIQDSSGHRSQGVLITTRYAPTVYVYNSDNIKVISASGTAKGGTGHTNFTVL